MRKLLGFLCVCALAIVTARAQDAVDDYVSSAAGQSVIYHGKEQLKYPTSIRNHPYLKREGFEPITLTAYISATLLSKFQIGNETVTIFNR